VVFGPKPRDFGKKVSKSTRKLALRKALSERLKAGDVVVVEDLKLKAPKTREFAGILAALELDGTTTLVVTEADATLMLAARNLPGVELTTGEELTTYQVLKFDKLLVTRAAFAKVEDRLAE
jgi:large subunit ribosomal protein L4